MALPSRSSEANMSCMWPKAISSVDGQIATSIRARRCEFDMINDFRRPGGTPCIEMQLLKIELRRHRARGRSPRGGPESREAVFAMAARHGTGPKRGNASAVVAVKGERWVRNGLNNT